MVCPGTGSQEEHLHEAASWVIKFCELCDLITANVCLELFGTGECILCVFVSLILELCV